MNNVLGTEAFLDRFAFCLWCRQKETHPAMEREKSETFKRWRNVYMLFAESLFLASNEKNNARQICSLPGIYCNRACTIIIFQTPTIRRRD